MYKPYHLIGLELGVSVLSAALRGEPTGQPAGLARRRRGGRQARPSRRRDARRRRRLHRLGQAGAGGRSLAPGALPIGLAHGVRLTHDIADGAVVRWSDVEINAGDDAIVTRRAMEARFGGAASNSS